MNVKYKIILLGDTNVGKTTLYNAFNTKKVDSVPILNTTGSTCISKNIELSNNEMVEVQIWDTAGQETYRSITKTYVRDANVAIICFDESAFDSIANWVEFVREDNSACHFVIALTKTDLIENSALEDITNNVNNLIKNRIDNSQTQVSTPFLATSGKTLENVDELFKKAAEFSIADKELIQANDNNVDLEENNQTDSKCKC